MTNTRPVVGKESMGEKGRVLVGSGLSCIDYHNYWEKEIIMNDGMKNKTYPLRCHDIQSTHRQKHNEERDKQV